MYLLGMTSISEVIQLLLMGTVGLNVSTCKQGSERTSTGPGLSLLMALTLPVVVEPGSTETTCWT